MKYKIIPSIDRIGKHGGHVICIPSDYRPAARSPISRTLKKLGTSLGEIKKKEGFKGRDSQEMYIRILKGKSLERIILLGLGKKASVDATLLRRRFQRVGTILRARNITRPVILMPEGLVLDSELCLRAIVLGLELGSGKRTTYATSKARSKAGPTLGQIVIPDCDTASLGRRLPSASLLGEIIVEARSWVSEPANKLGPDELARRAAGLGKRHGVASEVWTQKRIRKERLGFLEAVGKGSSRKPRFVRMRWKPRKKGRAPVPHVVLVGKGIVFDTGGLSLKPPKSMPAMKNDMAGAATAAAATAAAAALRIPVRVTALLAIAENTPSAAAYRPGDVISGRAGKTVEVINTDAEGRLVMADALSMAADMKPDAIIDVATLTGSCIVALGSLTAGMWSNDDGLADAIVKAAGESGESMWRMPLLDEIMPFMRSDVADIRNTQADPYGGAIAAALFLREFIGQSPWAHLDIAGPAFHEKRTEAGPRGATGYGIATLVRFLENLSTS